MLLQVIQARFNRFFGIQAAGNAQGCLSEKFILVHTHGAALSGS
jgi:hypothetical protein